VLGSCFGIGYGASLAIPAGRGGLDGLTIFTLSRRDPENAP
jgi:hypothetical protein